jgi:hypothetical protein
MHYSVLVTVNPDENDAYRQAIAKGQSHRGALDNAVESILAPYGDGCEWDWYQIGGRWTGLFDGYDPHKDPAHKSKCTYCAGTGTRIWPQGARKCNACENGVATAWPTEFKPHDGDIMPLEQLTQEQLDKFFAIVPDGAFKWCGGEDYTPWKEDGEKFQRRERPPLEWVKQHGTYAVVVDCHN